MSPNRSQVPGVLAAVTLALALAAAGAARAQVVAIEDDEEDERGPRGPSWDIDLELEVRGADGLDEPDRPRRDATRTSVELGVEARQRFGEGFGALVELELRSRRTTLPDDVGSEADRDEFRVGLDRLYLQHERGSVRTRLGRQSLDDAMGWVLDAELDGLRVTLERERWKLDASFTREHWFEVGEERRGDRVNNLLLRVPIDAAGRSEWVPYLLHRSERAFEGEPTAETTWFGLQGLIRLDRHVRYWLNAAARTGERERDSGTLELGGSAFDLGLTWTLDRSSEPAFTLGYARASGNGSNDDGADDGFRQSGLHENDCRLNGHNRFRYLGIAIDPELANLEVLTLGTGIAAGSRWALDLVYHRYRQRVAEDRLRGSDFELDPEGTDRAIGDAIDLVVGYAPRDPLELRLGVGAFEPGSAFASGTDRAWSARLEVEYDLY